MLTNLDDYPIHQFAEPMRYVATSDRNFYDRYYFMGFEKSGEAMFIAGLGVYPNLGVTDAFLAVMHEGQYRVVRASQELELSDRLKPSVGPISVEVVEALRKLRVRCEPNEWGIEFDCTFTGFHEPLEEPRHYVREQGRIIFDTTRLAQTGNWDGTLTVGGKTFDVNANDWYGTRDRSWGVRPIGESEPPGIRAKQHFSWFWLYCPIQFEDHSLVIIMQEHQDGSRVMEEAVRIWPIGSAGPGKSKPNEVFTRPRHAMDFVEGSRFSTGAHLIMNASTDRDDDAPGELIDITVEPKIAIHIGIGTGYGYDPDWKHGMWQGAAPVVQNFELDTNTPEGKARLFGIVDNGAKFTYTDSRGTHVGYGLYENLIVGPHDQYGFTDMMDGFVSGPS